MSVTGCFNKSTNDAIGRVLCHTQPSVDHEVPGCVAVSSYADRLRWPCDAVVRLARKTGGMASDNEAEAAATVETLAPEVRGCLVSFGVRARTVSRIIGLSPPPKLQLTAQILPNHSLNKLLLVGFAGVFRRSELAALQVRDLKFTDAGAIATIRRSKGDQEEQRRKVVLPREPIRPVARCGR
jgi:hypothetical protein